MSSLITSFPPLLNSGSINYSISNSAFNAKLAVTSSGGSSYPRHIDNPLGVKVGDTRKLTVIIYLNPEWREEHEGNLVLHLENEDVEVTPESGRFVVFWSDVIPHSVTPTNEDFVGEEYDRYALTIWLPTEDVGKIHDEDSKFKDLKV